MARSTAVTEIRAVAERLADIGRRFDSRNWVLGTSGNFSAVVQRDPLRLAITPSGAAKGDLDAGQILEVDGSGAVAGTATGKPSAETRLHIEIVNLRGANAVLHTHSMWSTLLSNRHAASGGLRIAGYEMLKGLEGVTTHEHEEFIPVLENDQDMTRLAVVVQEQLRRYPDAHAFLLRRHGMYTWGETLAQAVRHVEIVEFLLEAVARSEEAAWRS
jgi:methylthioribulose-1-phosphate dehydratase